MAEPTSRRAQKTKPTQLKIRVGVFGAGGRMGHEILSTAKTFMGEPCFLAMDSQAQEQKTGQALDAKYVVTSLAHPKCKDVEVWIDFSSPKGFDEIRKHCEKQKTPLVSGTTGLSPFQLKSLKKTSVALLWSPNMSLGINVLIKALQSLRGVEGFDYQIEEAHHRHKKDKPSGTALLLQDELEKVTQEKWPTPLAIRGGGIFGIHKIWGMSDEETITFEHQALNRAVFAKGALRAALWLFNKKPGLYSMQNLLEGE